MRTEAQKRWEDRNRAKLLAKERAHRQRRREAGICVYARCHNPAVPTLMVCAIHRERQAFLSKKQRIQAKARAFAGRACECCGESNIAFLTLDHVKGDGNIHRWRGSGRDQTVKTYLRIIRDGMPTFLQVLCFNCNCAKKQDDHCPHEDELRAILRVVA